MNNQFSQGNNSPNINGSNNILGDHNKQKNKTNLSIKERAEYTVGGIIIGIAISFVGSYLVSTCAGTGASAEKVSVQIVDSIQVK